MIAWQFVNVVQVSLDQKEVGFNQLSAQPGLSNLSECAQPCSALCATPTPAAAVHRDQRGQRQSVTEIHREAGGVGERRRRSKQVVMLADLVSPRSFLLAHYTQFVCGTGMYSRAGNSLVERLCGRASAFGLGLRMTKCCAEHHRRSILPVAIHSNNSHSPAHVNESSALREAVD
ncbi:unnamed protein product [Pleuronectes platessa]|uniref:Uncharacterized protein n=1 Tax=Pleuronectes platessa TaxID=8262 RepID=A0A9N7VAT8_PLEPL|nr:unnamed protein product [Pleuronectes platessa]